MNPLGDNGKNGNDVDFAQRTAPSMRRKGNTFYGDVGTVFSENARDEMEHDEKPFVMDPEEAKEMEKLSWLPNWKIWEMDKEKQARFNEYLRNRNGGQLKMAEPKAVEENEQPFDQNKFFGNIKEMQKQVPKKL